MYLLKLLYEKWLNEWFSYLHSTMYLLKLPPRIRYLHYTFIFTFHYVSIKTMKILFFTLYLLHLHSTMYLLKLPAISKITSFYSVFTFHYVSIKTKTRLSVRSIQNYLHSTMYLLKPVTLRNNHFLHTIYIPLCIY